MKFSKKQFDFLINSNARINLLTGSVRSGKTFILNIKWLDYIANGPEGVLMMVGKTIRTLENNVLMASPGGLFELLGEGNYKYNRSTGELHIGKRKIICIGANDEKAEGKIRGLTLAGALVDEITLCPQNFVTQLLARCSIKGAQQFWSTNPDNPYHYIKKDYMDNPKLNHKVKKWHFLMEDNPVLDPEYVADLKLMYTGVWYKRMILGEWVLAEGLVYPHFDKECIVDKLPEEFDDIYIGVDHGTVHPTAFIMFGVKDGAIYVIKEYYQSGKRNIEMAKDFVDFVAGYDINDITCDSAALQFIKDLEAEGFHVADCEKSVNDGIGKVGSLLAENKLFVHRSCVNLIKEFYSYSWDAKKSEASGKDIVVKLQDDALDALRYGIMTFCNSLGFQILDRNFFGF